MDRIIFVFLPILLMMLCVRCHYRIIRQTQNGLVEGLEQVTSLGQKYFSFRGIPFAAPPITGRDPFTGKQVDRRFKVH